MQIAIFQKIYNVIYRLYRDQKIIKKFNARPRGRAVVYAFVKPAESGGEVHNARARINTLRGEVCAVAAYI